MHSSIDPQEIAKFDQMAKDWWSHTGDHRVLHDLLPLRIDYLQAQINKRGLASFKGLRILDVGCGGGVLCEALTRLGAKVTGVDASAQSIEVARAHAEAAKLDISYICGDVASVSDTFDLVVALEIIEHVRDVTEFVKSLAARAVNKGTVVISTLNRTQLSYWAAIVGAEKILRWLPEGTHDWNKFVKPSEISGPAINAGLQTSDIKGYSLNPISRQGYYCETLAVNYFMSLVKS